MTKDVWISIRGLQFEGAEDAEEIEVLQKGQYYKRNGTNYLIYEEPVEGSSAIIKNTIKFYHSNTSKSIGFCNLYSDAVSMDISFPASFVLLS